MPYAKNARDVVDWIEPIQGDIAARAVADHQLAALSVHPAADLRGRLKNRHRAANLFQSRLRRGRGLLGKKIDDALENRERRVRVDYPRHRTGLGRLARRPAIFASR